MLTLNDTPLNDNQARFVVKIESDTPIYLSNYLDGITLSSVLYDGAPLVKNSLQDNGKSIDPSMGGRIGNIQAFQLQIARYQTNTELNEFFNDLFPATGKQYLVARPISIGFCWEGADGTGGNDVTWFFYGYIDEYSYNADTITLLCLEYAELENIELPYYKVQKENDNGVSYFLNAPEENYGFSLPIVYGDFTIYRDSYLLFRPILFPIICIDKRYQRYACASHKFYDEEFSTGGGTASFAFQYVSGLKTYMTLICGNGSATNNNYIAYVTHFDSLTSTDNLIYGTINIRPTLIGSINESDDCLNIVDDDNSNTAVSDSTGGDRQYISMKIDGNANPGLLSRQAGSILLYYTVSDGTVDMDIVVGYWNNEFNSGVGGFDGTVHVHYTGGDMTGKYDMSSDFGARDVIDSPWTWDELCNLEYYVAAETVDTITFKTLWLRITNIIVSDIRPTPRVLGEKRTRDTYDIRNSGRIR